MKPSKMLSRSVAFGALFHIACSINPAIAQPPTRDPHTPGYVTATELADGANPSPGANGNFIIGPTHDPAPESTVQANVPQGMIFHFTMESRDSKIYPGIAREPKTGKSPAEDLPLLNKFVGDYITPEGVTLGIELKNDSLFYRIGKDAYLMVKDSALTWSMFYEPDLKFKFSASNSNAFLATTPTDKYYFKRYTKMAINDDHALQTYTGTYYSPELDCNYRIALKDHQLYLTNAKYDDQKLTFAGGNDLLDDNWWMNHLVITRNSKNEITGFEVNSGRVMHLKFVKTK